MQTARCRTALTVPAIKSAQHLPQCCWWWYAHYCLHQPARSLASAQTSTQALPPNQRTSSGCTPAAMPSQRVQFQPAMDEALQ